MEEKIGENKDVVQSAETAPKTEAKEPVENAEIVRLKAALSKANAEAADWKRQLREKQTEAERIEAERAEREKQREARIAELEAKERIGNYRTLLMEAGIDALNADLMAKSLPDGVGADYFAAVKAANELTRKNLVGESLASQPGLSIGTPPKGKTPDEVEMEKLRKSIGL